MRVKTGVVRRAKHNKMLAKTKGFQGRRRSVYKLAKQAVLKAGVYAYRDRKVNKRNFRSLWIVRINAGLQSFGISYSQFINKLLKANITLNRKFLADLATNHPAEFEAVVKKVK
ncbi:MAG: 50S ribosomal protein L20 [Patescibacteria group bacterium]|jgi:large subunit ribosomal protein L20